MGPRALWIAIVITLGSLSYGVLAWGQPGFGDGVEGATYWDAFFAPASEGFTASTAYAAPVRGDFYLTCQSCTDRYVGRIPGSEVEAALPRALARLRARAEVGHPVPAWQLQLAREVAERGLDAAQTTARALELEEAALPERGGFDEAFLDTHRALPPDLEQPLRALPLKLLGEWTLWTALAFLLLGTAPPGQTRPSRAARRAALWPVGVAVLLLSVRALSQLEHDVGMGWPQHPGTLAPLESLARRGGAAVYDVFRSLPTICVCFAGLGGLLSWAWGRPRPPRARWAILEAALLALPLALGLVALAACGASAKLEALLPAKPLLPFGFSLLGTSWLALTGAVFVHRLHLRHDSGGGFA